MFKICGVFVAFLSGMVYATNSSAQMQQGYTNDKPDIMVDRSVLEDLKDYQPPPMFGSSPDSPEVIKPVEIKIIPPPTQPTLTAPKAEDLLSHPVENFRVLTERDSVVTPPQPTIKKISPQKESKKPVKTPVKTKEKKIDKELPKIKASVKPSKTEPLEALPQSSKGKGYRPKAPQSMPAVPPIRVEQHELPPLSGQSALPLLPSTLPTAEEAKPISPKKPSIGERLMDAALNRNMETDTIKIKEKLADTKIKTIQPKNVEKTPDIKTPSNTLVFLPSQNTLTDVMKQHITQDILGNLKKDTQSRIQILSFATSPDKSESSARRIALTRSLDVRDYLKKQGIDVSRIDVRALASTGNSIPPDKVDIILLK